MVRKVQLKDTKSVFEEVSYPIVRTEAAQQFDVVTLDLADGTENLGSLIADSPHERFDSVAALEAELHNVLPRNAVCEPFQSEGEG